VKRPFKIGRRLIGPGRPAYIIAEISANHNGSYGKAAKIVRESAKAGVDAIKLQTYTPDTITIDSHRKWFKIKGTIWAGKNLHNLYEEAYTPWDWQPRLKKLGESLGLQVFSSPFDTTAVDFLERMRVPAYKVASFEINDIPLLEKIAKTSKPVIVSTGMATKGEIAEALATLKRRKSGPVALLKCTSAYPAAPEEMDLKTIPAMAKEFGLPVGLSDHTLGTAVPVAAAALGACIIEKHVTLSRKDPGPDSSFSLEPHELKEMVASVRFAERSLGEVRFGPSPREKPSRAFRRSLFVTEDVKKGGLFTKENLRSIRPAAGLHTRHLRELLGRKASKKIQAGTPMAWSLVTGGRRKNG